MNAKILFLAATLVAAALAGCADNGPATTTPTPTATPTVTPTATPTVTPTVTPTTPTNDTEEPMEPLVCAPPAANNTLGTNMGYPEAVFTVKEAGASDPCFGFVGPDTIPAGWTAITLQNNGMQPHIMPMYRVDDGSTTYEEVRTLLATAEGEVEGFTPLGGVGIATPFSAGTVLMNLTAGQYVAVCFFGGHHVQGMYRIVNVTEAPASETPAAAPSADLTITMNDFSFAVPNVTSGTQVVAFHNNGTQPHEAPVVRLTGNATMQEFLNAVETAGPSSPPPPGAGVGGVNIVAPGQTAYAIVNFTPGNYGLVCFVSSPAHDGAPHVALGMVAQFAVA